MQISKELLSNVLNKNVKRILNLKIDNQINYEIDAGFRDINIYELSHKCKQWAYEQEPHFEIESRIIMNNTGGYNALPVGYACILYDNMPYYECKSENEISAIFEACQWILDKRNLCHDK